MTQLAPVPDIDLPDLTEGIWLALPALSAARFEVGHPHFAKVRGSIPISGGQLAVGPDLETTSVNLEFNPSGVHTGWGERDDELLGPNFFDVVSYPVWSFISSSIRREGRQYSVQGDLTVHGLTRRVGAVAQFDGIDTAGGARLQAAFTADGRLDRTDFALTWTDAQAISLVRTAREVAVGVHLVVTPAETA
jgi:polyisoprenoid-binding protein YceI